jgi:hypothetical protein
MDPRYPLHTGQRTAIGRASRSTAPMPRCGEIKTQVIGPEGVTAAVGNL